MSEMTINIPKNTILKAVMGNGSYKNSNQARAFDEPRKKERYFYTEGRLPRAQLQILLEMHRLIDSKGYAYDVAIRDIAQRTHLTMQCVNKSIKSLESKGFIVIGIKEYGYLNYFIDIEQGYSESLNTGGYYQMDHELLTHLLSLERIDDLRLALIGILEDDFSRVKTTRTFLSLAAIRRIIPGKSHPKAREEILKTKEESPYRYQQGKDGVYFILDDEYYGKYTNMNLANMGKVLIEELIAQGITINKKNEKDVISLCQEYGYEMVRRAIYSLPAQELKSNIPLGLIVRGVITSFTGEKAS